MDSLDAQCLVVQLAEEDGAPSPNVWLHGSDGSLGCAFSGGSRTYTWRASEVSEVAERWRRSKPARVPTSLASIVDTHRRFARIVEEAGLDPPDVVVHDLGRSEVRAVWTAPKLVVVIDEIPDGVDLGRRLAAAA
jgi:hypothetical protein